MHKVNSIRIAGFRRLREVSIEMRPLTVLIGANGVGKSSILDAVSLLSASAAGTMNIALNELGGVAEVSTRGQDKKITLAVEMSCPGSSRMQYELQVEASGQGYAIPTETLSQEKSGDLPETFKLIESHSGDVKILDAEANRLVKPEWELDPLESSLSQVPKTFKRLDELRRAIASVTHCRILDVARHAPVKLPQQMKPALLPGENGEDLVPFLYNLRESDHDHYEAVEDTLKVAFPGFEGLSFPPVAAGTLSLTWKEKHFRDPIYMHQLSEGKLRFLWQVALLHSPGLPAITMIDEPEVSLHPELLSLLADLWRGAARRTQIVVATHSDRLVGFLEPREVMVMDTREDGCAVAQWADAMDLERWLKDYTLDEVWRMGRMGGRA